MSANQRLLESIITADWDAYQVLCDASLTCFEAEARGELVVGLGFHRYYFTMPGAGKGVKHVSMISPHVRMLGEDAAVLSYVRLTQSLDATGSPQTSRFEETRVWQRIGGQWKHVHFHRSANA